MAYRFASALLTFVTLGAAVASAFDCISDGGRLIGGRANGVVAVGNLAVIGSGSRLVVIDVSTPTTPDLVGELDLGDPAAAHGGSYVLPLAAWTSFVVASVSCGASTHLVVIDLGEPAAPAVAGELGLFGPAVAAVVVDDVAWVAAPAAVGDVIRGALIAVDLSDPADPLELGRYEAASVILDVAAEGAHVAVLEIPPTRLTLLDVRSPSNPTVLSHTAVTDASAQIELAGVRAYVATRDTIEVFDVTDPTVPAHEMSVPWLRIAGTADLRAVGDRLYLGLGDFDPQIGPPDGGLEVFALPDPSSITERSSVVFSSGGTSLAASDNILLVADPERGLRVFETDNLSSPIRPGVLNPTIDQVTAVAVDADFVFLGDHGLRVVDLTAGPRLDVVAGVELNTPMVYDPDQGVIVELDRTVWDVAAEAGGLAALTTSDGVLVVYDVSDPTRPVERAQHRIPQMAGSDWSIALSGTLAVAAGHAVEGLATIDLSDPDNPAVLGRAALAGPAADIALVGNLAVVATGPWPTEPERGGLVIFDIGDPAAPVATASVPFDRVILALAVKGDQLVAADREAVHVVDFADPYAPEEVGTLTGTFGRVGGVAIGGSRAFISISPGGLAVVSLDDPEHPRLVAQLTWQPWTAPDGGPIGGFDVSAWNGHAVVADGAFRAAHPRLLEVSKPVPSAPYIVTR